MNQTVYIAILILCHRYHQRATCPYPKQSFALATIVAEGSFLRSNHRQSDQHLVTSVTAVCVSRAAPAILVVISSDSNVLGDSLNVSHCHAYVALLAAGAARTRLRNLRSRGWCRGSLVCSSCLCGSRLGRLGLAGGSGAGFRFGVDDIGRGVVVNGRGSRFGNGNSGGRLGLLYGWGVGRLGGSGRGLLGGLGCSIYIARVNLTRQDSSNIDALLLLSKDLVLVGRALEVTRSALVVDTLALGLPELATCVAGDWGRVKALL